VSRDFAMAHLRRNKASALRFGQNSGKPHRKSRGPNLNLPLLTRNRKVVLSVEKSALSTSEENEIKQLETIAGMLVSENEVTILNSQLSGCP
jgi:hypothetical protein